MSDDTSSHVRVSHLYDELLLSQVPDCGRRLEHKTRQTAIESKEYLCGRLNEVFG